MNAAASGFGKSGSFSASASYKKAVKEVTKGDTTTSEIVGRAIVYKARLSSTGTISKVNIYISFDSFVNLKCWFNILCT